MITKVEMQCMAKPEPLELFVECPRERMDELLDAMRKMTKRPWMFWETHYTASFSPPDPSFDFARFKITEADVESGKSEKDVQYQGQVRWSKQPDFNVLLVWEAGTEDTSNSDQSDFLMTDFNELIASPACASLGLRTTIGPGAWRNRLK